jgi:hypothetical protein
VRGGVELVEGGVAKGIEGFKEAKVVLYVLRNHVCTRCVLWFEVLPAPLVLGAMEGEE